MYAQRTLAVIFYLLGMPAALPVDAGEFKSPAVFQTSDCEDYLQGREGRVHLRRVLFWLAGLRPLDMNVYKIEISRGEAPSPEVLNPRIVWFTTAPGESYDSVLSRYMDAVDRSEKYYEIIQAQIERDPEEAGLSGDALLSAIEMEALGIAGQMATPLSGLYARLNYQPSTGTGSVLHIELMLDEMLVGEFDLPISTLKYGFRDRAAAWQSHRLTEAGFIPAGASARPDKLAFLRQFFEDNGRFLLLRQTRRMTLAYVFNQEELRTRADRVESFELRIYQVEKCRPGAPRKSDLIIPYLEGMEHCLVPTGLRLSLPYELKIERSVVSPGWFGSQTQM